MEVVRRKFSSKCRRKDVSSHLSGSFRKSLETSCGPVRDHVDDGTEMCRKAAAWAWHHRAGGDLVPTRESVAKITAAVQRDSKVRRAKTRFRAEAMREIDRDSTVKSESYSETNTLSSLLKRITLLAESLREESSQNNSFALPDGANTLNRLACDPSRTSVGQSESCRFHQHESDSEEESAVLSQRSFSCLSSPRHNRHTYSKSKMERRNDDYKVDGSDETDFVVGVPKHRKNSASFRKSISVIQTLYRKIYRANGTSHAAISEQVHNHHHYHYHHHYYHPRIPNEELQDIERAKVRRNSETFRVNREVEWTDKETQRIRRHSGSNFASNSVIYPQPWVTVGDGAEVQRHYDYSPDEQVQSIPANYISKVIPSRRFSDSFNISQPKMPGSPIMKFDGGEASFNISHSKMPGSPIMKFDGGETILHNPTLRTRRRSSNDGFHRK